jgi:hypothetical protein
MKFLASWLAGPLLAAVAAASHAAGPNTGTPTAQRIDDAQLGIALDVPAGWTTKRLPQALLLGSTTVPGIVLVTGHEHADLDAVRAQARQGIEDGAGTALRLHGELRDVELADGRGVAGEFRGRFDGMPATAYVVGIVNPHGEGLTVTAVTDPAKYGDAHREVALAVAHSVRFSVPREPEAVATWRGELAGRRLAYLGSYSSRVGGSTGMQMRDEMHLCGDGSFARESNSDASFDSGGAFGSSRARGSTLGQWSVVPGADGSSMFLRLQLADGRRQDLRLALRSDGHLNLDGSRWFRSRSGRCG